jgi:hypothetical protein
MINVPNIELTEQICLDSFIYDQINNPIEFLDSFFERHDLQAHFKKMKRWKLVVTTTAYFEINTLFNPLHDHKMMCNLLNAAWCLQEKVSPDNSLISLSMKEQEIFLNRECLGVPFYPSNLSTAELIDPYVGIKHFFESFTLHEAHHCLYEWLNVGLSPNVTIFDEELAQSFYKSLRKLIAACWIILHRTKQSNRTNELSASGIELINDLTTGDAKIPEHVLDGFKQFLSIVPAERLNRGLRKMLIDYLFYNIDGLPTDFEETLTDFYWLTDLLDEIQGKEVDPKFM